MDTPVEQTENEPPIGSLALSFLRSPVTGNGYTYVPASFTAPKSAPVEAPSPPLDGYLDDGSDVRVPIVGGIPRFVSSEAYTASFGYQWNRFDVVQEEEDAATFAAKAGVRPEKLTGCQVLDVGCGGGRYCRVLAPHASFVMGVDHSRAVEKARAVTAGRRNVQFLQADLNALPLREASFDFVFSIGVLHHGPDTKAGFNAISRLVRPGGRLSVWVYRRNTWPQERVNDGLRAVARRLSPAWLVRVSRIGAVMGGVPIINRTLNKIISFSNHPRWENRVCDTFDWYSPTYQHHHTPEEVRGWFIEAGFDDIQELPPEKEGRLYRSLHNAGLLVGSGVNMTGVRGPA